MRNIKIGTQVIKNGRYYVPPEKQGKIYTVVSEPWEVGGTAVVELYGETAGYALDGLTPVEEGWISVKDRLPEKGTNVLLSFPSNMAVGYWTTTNDSDDPWWFVMSGGNNWCVAVNDNDEQPTHWLELPAPPVD